MRVLRRAALLAGCLGLATAAGLPATAAHAGVAAPATTTITVHGTLLVAVADSPAGGTTSYGLELAGGGFVRLRGPFPAAARTGWAFSGRLAVPSSVAGVAGSSSTALRTVERKNLMLSVVGSPTLTAPATAAATATVHRQFVAAIDNKGALGQDDATLLNHVATVGGYWADQSNGAISGLTVPATVTHYNTAVSTTDCGLGSDFGAMVNEAKGKFPGFNQAAGDQLVLFVPPACASGGIVGEGTVGASFASGGLLIVKAGAGIDGVYGHETGHNYGFGHAYARWSGTALEYYGVYDVMGFAVGGAPGGGNFNQLTALGTPLRVFQGVTDPGEIQDVVLGDHTQAVHATATIQPRTDGSGLRSVRVVDPDTGETLYVDYRSGGGRDAGSVYAFQGGLSTPAGVTPSGVVHYAPGVVISAAHAGGAIDYLTLDSGGDTSLTAGGTWANASGDLTVHVTSAAATGAVVDVDFTPATQPFTTTATPVIGGTVAVGGTVTLDPGSWTPTPSATTIRWTANGAPVPGTDDKTSFVPGPGLLGEQLVATVTASKPGLETTAAQSAPVTVAAGTIALTSPPSITGTSQVGFVLHAHTATWGTTQSPVSGTWQWRADGVDIPGATAADYTVQPGDVGSVITVAQHLTATAYQDLTTESAATSSVPTPVISPAPAPTVGGTAQVGTPLTAQTGTWMSGVTLALQWYVGGQPVAGATGTSYTPRAEDLGQTVRVEVTGTRADYPDLTTASAETPAVALGVLVTAKPTITGTASVGRTLTAKPGTWTAGTSFTYAWFADGVVIKGQTAKKLVLAKAQRGHRITVKVTGTHPGYNAASRTSAATAKVV